MDEDGGQIVKGLHDKPLWIPRDHGVNTRWHREGAGGYSLRHVADRDENGKMLRKRWALFAGDDRVQDVQPEGLLSKAISAAEKWIDERS